MQLKIQQLNADTTFLLDFDDFTILIDPWLTGSSPIFHESFAVARHTTDSTIQSLAELEKSPDLIIISQAKNDHCHKETLSTLPKTWKGTIAATTAAAKKILGWKLFSAEQVIIIQDYNSSKPAGKIALPNSLRPTAEMTLSNIPSPFDLSAVHNAVAFTIDQIEQTTDPLRVLYTPHGIAPPLLKAYLTKNPDLLPLDILIHSLNVEANPLFLGGVIANGAPGGLDLVKTCEGRVKNWIGAHDEAKDNGGIAVKLIRCQAFGVEEVEGMLADAGVDECRVWSLGVGGVLSLEADGEKLHAKQGTENG